jgi:transposase
VIWHFAQGQSCAESAALTGFALRWMEQLFARYNTFGPASLGDRRRGNGAEPRLLTPEMLAELCERVKTSPKDGGVWTAKKVAAFMAAELGLVRVAEQRGLGGAAVDRLHAAAPAARGTPARRAPRSRRRSKNLAAAVAEEAARHPGAAIETFATDGTASG